MQDENTMRISDEMEFQRVKTQLGLSDQEVEDHKGDARAIWEKSYHKFKEANESEYSGRRWFWELVQNAIDSLQELHEKVDVRLKITLRDVVESVAFSHNGGIFKNGTHIDDIDDFENFIRPGSSKPMGESQKGGRFGTGFLSTHCLSPRIRVAGICIDSQGQKYWNETDLDRSEITKEDTLSVRISKLKITRQLVDFRNNKRQADYHVANKPSARITYLSPVSEENLRDGLKELEHSLIYVFAFNPQLNSVIIEEGGKTRVYKNLQLDSESNGNHIYATLVHSPDHTDVVKKVLVRKHERFDLAWSLLNGVDDVAMFADKRESYFTTFNDNMASLYCRYPLIGSGDFKFPVIINSREFRPEEKRNGINLKEENQTNKEILALAVTAYKGFLLQNSAVGRQFNVVDIFIKSGIDNLPQWVDKVWYRTIIDALKSTILECAQLRVGSEQTITLGQAKIPYIRRDEFDDEFRLRFWGLVKKWRPETTPIENEYLSWYNRIDFSVFPVLKLSIEDLLAEIQGCRSMQVLSEKVPHAFEWLKEVVQFTCEIDKELLNKFEVIPNQLGDLVNLKQELFRDDHLSRELIEIHDSLHNVSYKKLLLDPVFASIQGLLPEYRLKNEHDLAKSIDDLLYKIDSTGEMSVDSMIALQLMFKWMAESGKSEAEIKELFPLFYPLRPVLFLATIPAMDREKVLAIAQSGKLAMLSTLANSDLSAEQLSKLSINAKSLVQLSDVLENVKDGMDKLMAYATNLKSIHEDFQFKLAIGNLVEQVFMEALLKYNFDNESLKVQYVGTGAYDFIITNLNNEKEFFIELKSHRNGSIAKLQLAPKQAAFANNHSDNYALVILERPCSIDELTINYIESNLKVRMEVGALLIDSLADYNKFLEIDMAKNLHLILGEEIRLNVKRARFLNQSSGFWELIHKINIHLQ